MSQNYNFISKKYKNLPLNMHICVYIFVLFKLLNGQEGDIGLFKFLSKMLDRALFMIVKNVGHHEIF